MIWKRAVVSGFAILLLTPLALAAKADPAAAARPSALSVDQIIAKNIEARGGLQAWQAVQTMSYSGRMDAGGKTKAQLPFSMELKRPRMSRVEIEFANDRAVQVYDGVNGWKLRPFLGRRTVEPFSAEELQAASMQADLDGPLVDYARKGTKVRLEGMEKVEGNDAYKLKLTLKDGQVRRLWIDAGTFLESKIEGAPRRMDGKLHSVDVYYRDFRSVDGLMVPYVLESAVVGTKQTSRMYVESVTINPALEDSRFTKPRPEAAPGAGGPSATGATPDPGNGSARPATGS